MGFRQCFGSRPAQNLRRAVGAHGVDRQRRGAAGIGAVDHPDAETVRERLPSAERVDGGRVGYELIGPGVGVRDGQRAVGADLGQSGRRADHDGVGDAGGAGVAVAAAPGACDGAVTASAGVHVGDAGLVQHHHRRIVGGAQVDGEGAVGGGAAAVARGDCEGVRGVVRQCVDGSRIGRVGVGAAAGVDAQSAEAACPGHGCAAERAARQAIAEGGAAVQVGGAQGGAGGAEAVVGHCIAVADGGRRAQGHGVVDFDQLDALCEAAGGRYACIVGSGDRQSPGQGAVGGAQVAAVLVIEQQSDVFHHRVVGREAGVGGHDQVAARSATRQGGNRSRGGAVAQVNRVAHHADCATAGVGAAYRGQCQGFGGRG